MGYVNNFDRKTKTGHRFHGRGMFFRQSSRRGKFPGPRIAVQNACQKEERENFNHAVFALAFFSRRQDRELLGMTLVPHLLDLLFKREIRSACGFALAKTRSGDRKQIARELREEIVSMRSRGSR